MSDNTTQGEKITKKEGVRRALAELGKDAPRAQIQGYVKDHFGLDISLDHISATRGELDKASEKPLPEPAKKEESISEPISKSEAVRRAVHELGMEATRGQIHEFIKERFGIEMNLDHISTAKGEAIRKLTGNSKPAPKSPAPKAAVTPKPQQKPVSVPPPAEPAVEKPTAVLPAIPMDDILALKSLVERIGAEQVRMLMGVMGK